jgi:Tat protein secretion system quality control protein TatD with DNase activity
MHEGRRIRINDTHIHIGHSKDIYKSLNNVKQFQVDNDIGSCLIMGNSLRDNDSVELMAANDANIYGLYWISTHGNFFDLTNSRRMVGCKFHGAYEQKPITNPVYADILDYLEDKRAILMIHCGRYKEAALESTTSYLHALKIATEYPQIKVIMAHMGGTDTSVSKFAILEAIDFDNIYFDTSGITIPYIIEFAVEHIGSNRILFGSDAPWCSFKAMYHTVNDAEIGHKEKENIFHENFNKLIHIPTLLKNDNIVQAHKGERVDIGPRLNI